MARTGGVPHWPVIVLPALGAIFSLKFAWRGEDRLFSSLHWSLILCVSRFCAPYSWFYDQLVLAFAQVTAFIFLLKGDSSKRHVIVFGFVLLQSGALLLRELLLFGQLQFFWFSAALGVFVWVTSCTVEGADGDRKQL